MIAIIDYKAGNLTSVLRAVNRLGYSAEITADPKKIRNSEKVIFPGVGAAKATMDVLHDRDLSDLLIEIYRSGKPMLGICIGIQILFDHSDEENTKCLGIFKGDVKKFHATPTIKVPQIGWNAVDQIRDHWFFENIPDQAHFYFVNSYYTKPENPEIVIGKTNHGVEFCSVIAHENLIATQFHLEKSGEIGLRMLDNFLRSKRS